MENLKPIPYRIDRVSVICQYGMAVVIFMLNLIDHLILKLAFKFNNKVPLLFILITRMGK